MAEVEYLKSALEMRERDMESISKKNSDLEQEVEFVRSCLEERDSREEQLFQHSKQLCELVEAQRDSLAEKDRRISDLEEEIGDSSQVKDLESAL